MRVRLDVTRWTMQHAAGEEAHVVDTTYRETPIGQPYRVTVSLTRTGERLPLWSDELDIVRSPIQ